MIWAVQASFYSYHSNLDFSQCVSSLESLTFSFSGSCFSSGGYSLLLSVMEFCPTACQHSAGGSRGLLCRFVILFLWFLPLWVSILKILVTSISFKTLIIVSFGYILLGFLLSAIFRRTPILSLRLYSGAACIPVHDKNDFQLPSSVSSLFVAGTLFPFIILAWSLSVLFLFLYKITLTLFTLSHWFSIWFLLFFFFSELIITSGFVCFFLIS